jgi:hydrogenase assembly chaperone HypC/HupF
MCVETVGRVIDIPDPDEGIALVDVDGAVKRVSLALLVVEGVEVSVGDWLLTHTGLAVRVIDDDEANRLLEERSAILAVMGEGA